VWWFRQAQPPLCLAEARCRVVVSTGSTTAVFGVKVALLGATIDVKFAVGAIKTQPIYQ
jgi:hypothetical protein